MLQCSAFLGKAQTDRLYMWSATQTDTPLTGAAQSATQNPDLGSAKYLKAHHQRPPSSPNRSTGTNRLVRFTSQTRLAHENNHRVRSGGSLTKPCQRRGGREHVGVCCNCRLSCIARPVTRSASQQWQVGRVIILISPHRRRGQPSPIGFSQTSPCSRAPEGLNNLIPSRVDPNPNTEGSNSDQLTWRQVSGLKPCN